MIPTGSHQKAHPESENGENSVGRLPVLLSSGCDRVRIAFPPSAWNVSGDHPSTESSAAVRSPTVAVGSHPVQGSHILSVSPAWQRPGRSETVPSQSIRFLSSGT
ncbi:uncharacterized protein BDW43DRAFT_72331 [Aspergillus alliaceus]|uniref:uncharacterized protein n=1 Tax=Petromyces alliaceus TaxID=209559 RepID=UPI0012A656BC|nr:uncharacterized protein BDW43DRAFT_72331 [Aspergillus alliaceus]KAB8238980.1 hypothetical protein BDW43DRAFT_72331 [Aspergillus alliaceus]